MEITGKISAKVIRKVRETKSVYLRDFTAFSILVSRYYKVLSRNFGLLAVKPPTRADRGLTANMPHFMLLLFRFAWNSCPDGYFVSGFMRGDGNNLGSLEEGVCCKPPSAPNQWGDCYIEDITNSFDVDWATVGCQRSLYYIVAIYTHECDQISCMEELKCCTIANP